MSADETPSARKPSKGELTKAAIIDAALDLFEEVGFEATTMRAIAQRAGVSVGNAYYYFSSKDELIQGFYDQAAARHFDASAVRLNGIDGLADRVYAHVDTWFEVMGGYHEFAASFFRTAADPTSPMSPFSEQSAPARDAAIAQWGDVVAKSDAALPDDLTNALPELLWLYHMGIVMFWVHDRSADQMATRLLCARTVPMIVKLIGLIEVPELRSVVDDVVRLLADARLAFETQR